MNFLEAMKALIEGKKLVCKIVPSILDKNRNTREYDVRSVPVKYKYILGKIYKY